ncbi:MAG: MFS transporter [Deltaproteobacteria bacterium]|nr:MFS transporter [Deltaproteobacteria bacterium]
MDSNPETGSLERKTLFSIVCASHLVNHFQTSMMSVLFPLLMRDLGLSYMEIGVISTLRGMAGQFLQAMYGFIVPFVKRAIILGTGNFIVGLSVIATGFASSYSFVLGTRIFSGLGSSPQHPVGSTMLATHYPEARGRTLALHTTSGSIGSLLAPITAGLLLIHLDWRAIFWLVGGISFLTGVPYFLFRDVVRPATPRETLGGGKRGRGIQGWEAYKECLKNRNFLVISLVLMVGAAGRGGGVNTTFLIPHFVNDLKIDVTYASFLFTLLQLAGLVAPLLWGWASDRVSRVGTIQLSLLVSSLSTIWLGWVSSMSIWLLMSLAFYGLAVHSRQSLTQALLSDIVEEGSIDAAFSLYYAIGFISGPFWTLLTGWMMQRYGFGYAFSVIAVSYLVGMVLLLMLRDPRSVRAQT